MTQENDTGHHPWQGFLDARMRALVWLRDERKLTPEESAQTLSVDPVQVTLILMTADERKAG